VVVGLAEVDAGWIGLVGGKAAGLGELIRAGEPVPEGFCITTAAHDVVRAASGLVPDDLRREIVALYDRLGAGGPEDRRAPRVPGDGAGPGGSAVRSGAGPAAPAAPRSL
jgi:phosphoenolpyruvate synthase/pyruvate phosphate dikinase